MFQSPIISFLFWMAIGTCGVNGIFYALYKKGIIDYFNFKGIVVSLLALILFFAAYGHSLNNPSIVLAASAEPTEVQVAQAIEPPGCIFIYPENIDPWCHLIEANSMAHDVDPYLIAAVIKQESAGNPDAYSSSGAVGLMQVMPSDGIAASFQCINGPCFASRPSIQELYDPAFNVDYGTSMLAGLITKYGDTREALVAYGPMDVGYYYADLVLDIYENIKPNP